MLRNNVWSPISHTPISENTHREFCVILVYLLHLPLSRTMQLSRATRERARASNDSATTIGSTVLARSRRKRRFGRKQEGRKRIAHHVQRANILGFRAGARIVEVHRRSGRRQKFLEDSLDYLRS